MSTIGLEISPWWKNFISKFVNDARGSPNFDFQKTVELIDANDQDSLLKLLLTYAIDTYPHYVSPVYNIFLRPPYSEYNCIPVIKDEINKVFQLSDKKPCGCMMCNSQPKEPI